MKPSRVKNKTTLQLLFTVYKFGWTFVQSYHILLVYVHLTQERVLKSGYTAA